MFDVTLRKAPETAALWLASSSRGLLVLAESLEPLVSETVGPLFTEAANQSKPFEDGSPSRIAHILKNLLVSTPKAPPWLIFLCVLIDPLRIEVSQAGSHRLHLLQDGEMPLQTREHILRNDPEARKKYVEEARGRVSEEELLKFQGGLVTRVVGENSLTPETTIWHPRGYWSLVACSHDFHVDRDPAAYLDGVGRQPPDGPGTVAIIRSNVPDRT